MSVPLAYVDGKSDVKAAGWRPHPAKVGGMVGGGVAASAGSTGARGGRGDGESNISRCKIHPREKQPGHRYTIYRLIGGSVL